MNDHLIDSDFLSMEPTSPYSISQQNGFGSHMVGGVENVERAHAFSEIFGAYMSGVNTKLHDMDALAQGIAAGTVDSPEEVKLKLDEGAKTFELLMSIRTEMIKMHEQIRTMMN
jgi:flagellar hook-basal body complex protein FliE